MTHNLRKLAIAASIVSMLLVQTIPLQQIGAQTPYAVLGSVFDSEGLGVMGVKVFVNNTRNNNSDILFTDIYGRYSIDISIESSDPGACHLDDTLKITAIYSNHISSDTLVVKPLPYQMLNLTLNFRAYVIDGHVKRAVDGTVARYFNVQVTNEAKNESKSCLADQQGYYRMELSTFPGGFSQGDGVKVSVIQQGFSGVNYSSISANSGKTLNITLFDTQSPVPTIKEAPASVNLSQSFRIISQVTENYQLSSMKIYMKKSGAALFTEINMIMDDGAANDWNSDGMPNIQVWGQSTARNLPLQNDIGDLQYYILATDTSGNLATFPSNNPQNNPLIIHVIDPVLPTLSHVPITELEAGTPLEIVATADDNIGIYGLRMFFKGVGESAFTNVGMASTGEPKQYNASIPAQTSLGTFYYYLACNDTSNNMARLPATGEWPVSVVDTMSPVITHSKINSARLNGAINFTCSVSEILLDSVWLNYTYGAVSVNLTMSFDPVAEKWFHRIATLATLDTMFYTIWANDTSGNLAKVSHAFPVLDEDIPFIFHEPPEFIEVGIFTEIMAYVEDNANVSSVTLDYLSANGIAYNLTEMTNTDVPPKTGYGNYTTIIPAQATLGAVRYVINATDGTLNISWPSLSPYHMVDVIDTQPPVLSALSYANNTPSGISARVRVNATDLHSVSFVRLYYLNSTSIAWIALNMALEVTGSYECMIPAHAPGQVKFYLASNDSSDNMVTLPAITPKLAPYVMNFTDGKPPSLELSIPSELSVNRTAEAFLNVSDDTSLSSFEVQFSGINDFLFMPLELIQIGSGSFRCILPPQMESGRVRIFAAASDGNHQNQTPVYNISVVNLPPSITHTDPGIIPFGSNFSLIAQVSDDLHVENVSLEWKYLDSHSNLIEMRRTNNFYRVNLSFSEPSVINYRIIAHDIETFSVWPSAGYSELLIKDVQAPIIYHQPMVNFTTVDRPVISAQVMDDFQVISVKIWYRNSDFQAFQESNMEYDTDTNEYAVTLQAQPEGKFEYYLQAYDGNNTSVYPIDGYFSAEVIDVKPNAWPFLIAVTIAILILVFLHGLLFFRSRKSINDAADSGDERVENDENPR
jgi:hypothetical protein